jgi:uncharacterized oligopeptide transporter (OPT) family protein
MQPGQIWTRYVRYIGAGAVATAGIITLIRSIPVMVSSFRIGASQLGERVTSGTNAISRTSNDLPLRFVGFGALAIALVLILVPQVFGAVGGIGIRAVAAVCVVIFAFFFVTVASRIVGLVHGCFAHRRACGCNEQSDQRDDHRGPAGHRIAVPVVRLDRRHGQGGSIDGGLRCCHRRVDFRRHLAGRAQQTSELIGVLTSATFVCLTVLALGKGFGFGSEELPAPQATLMKLVIDGVLDQDLPWGLVAIGVGIAFACEIARIPSLPFAVGVYLPVSTMTPIFVGGLIRLWMERTAKDDTVAADRRERGVLLGSGFVGGEGLLGVGIALVAVAKSKRPDGIGMEWLGSEVTAMLVGAAAFATRLWTP